MNNRQLAEAVGKGGCAINMDVTSKNIQLETCGFSA